MAASVPPLNVQRRMSCACCVGSCLRRNDGEGRRNDERGRGDDERWRRDDERGRGDDAGAGGAGVTGREEGVIGACTTSGGGSWPPTPHLTSPLKGGRDELGPFLDPVSCEVFNDLEGGREKLRHPLVRGEG